MALCSRQARLVFVLELIASNLVGSEEREEAGAGGGLQILAQSVRAQRSLLYGRSRGLLRSRGVRRQVYRARFSLTLLCIKRSYNTHTHTRTHTCPSVRLCFWISQSGLLTADSLRTSYCNEAWILGFLDLIRVRESPSKHDNVNIAKYFLAVRVSGYTTPETSETRPGAAMFL